ncbi:voltage-gated potassium channel Kch [Paenibacillus amylolyticus]|uniref:Voltage-gated potassium channel Kch n=1 Tax=Paenibacillus amylolyticus TaxID=1451 RepID=A0AAP5LND4_PAEAM|nr:potassium channel family protein [Paenibacillus amylolyticus]MDR6725136.1 voltage-gated potassium channel Kch [Paenibacillus amylolyticus]
MISFLLTLKRLLKGIFHAFKDSQFIALFTLTLATLLSGTIFYSRVEGLHWIDALYFCAVTLTTVGHPEFVPSTGFSKAFTVIYMFAGIGLTFAMIAKITAGILFPSKKKTEENPE